MPESALNDEEPYTEQYVRFCGRSDEPLRLILLPDVIDQSIDASDLYVFLYCRCSLQYSRARSLSWLAVKTYYQYC